MQDLPPLGSEEVELEEIQIVFGNPGKTTWVASHLLLEFKQKFTAYLSKYKEVFASSPQEVRGISPRVMEHRLNVLLDALPVRKKKRHFGSENDKIISAEVTK